MVTMLGTYIVLARFCKGFLKFYIAEFKLENRILEILYAFLYCYKVKLTTITFAK